MLVKTARLPRAHARAQPVRDRRRRPLGRVPGCSSPASPQVRGAPTATSSPPAPAASASSSTPARTPPRASTRWSASTGSSRSRCWSPTATSTTCGASPRSPGTYDATAWIHPDDRHLLDRPDGRDVPRDHARCCSAATTSSPSPTTSASSTDLQELELAGLRFVVDHTPGHTEGSVTFRTPYDQRGRLRGDVLRRPALRRLDRPHRPARRRPSDDAAQPGRPRCCRWPTTSWCCPATASRRRSAASARPTRSCSTSDRRLRGRSPEASEP